jgi:hypothetical protein
MSLYDWLTILIGAATVAAMVVALVLQYRERCEDRMD